MCVVFVSNSSSSESATKSCWPSIFVFFVLELRFYSRFLKCLVLLVSEFSLKIPRLTLSSNAVFDAISYISTVPHMCLAYIRR